MDGGVVALLLVIRSRRFPSGLQWNALVGVSVIVRDRAERMSTTLTPPGPSSPVTRYATRVPSGLATNSIAPVNFTSSRGASPSRTTSD